MFLPQHRFSTSKSPPLTGVSPPSPLRRMRDQALQKMTSIVTNEPGYRVVEGLESAPVLASALPVAHHHRPTRVPKRSLSLDDPRERFRISPSSLSSTRN